jgi:hypothetical protein
MKIHRSILFVAALVVPQLAPAKVPVPEQSLGQLESILDFCAKADPKTAVKFQDVKKMLAGDATQEELAAARDKQEYKNNYQSTSEQLAKVPEEKAVKACSAYLNDGK